MVDKENIKLPPSHPPPRKLTRTYLASPPTEKTQQAPVGPPRAPLLPRWAPTLSESAWMALSNALPPPPPRTCHRHPNTRKLHFGNRTFIQSK